MLAVRVLVLRYLAQKSELAHSFAQNGVLLLIIPKFLLNHCKLVAYVF